MQLVSKEVAYVLLIAIFLAATLRVVQMFCVQCSKFTELSTELKIRRVLTTLIVCLKSI